MDALIDRLLGLYDALAPYNGFGGCNLPNEHSC